MYLNKSLQKYVFYEQRLKSFNLLWGKKIIFYWVAVLGLSAVIDV